MKLQANRPDRAAQFNTYELDGDGDEPLVHCRYPAGQARAMVARKVRIWRQAVREGRAISVTRNRGRDDLPAMFVIDWDGRCEVARVTSFDPTLRSES